MDKFTESFQKALAAAGGAPSGKGRTITGKFGDVIESYVIEPRKVTIYTGSDFGGTPLHLEAKEYHCGVRKWAQYNHAVELHWVPKGKRNIRGVVDTHDPLKTIILDGWSHPKGPSGYHPPEQHGGATVSMSKYLSFDPRYASDFNTFIDAYIKSKNVKVLADYRGQSPYHGRAR